MTFYKHRGGFDLSSGLSPTSVMLPVLPKGCGLFSSPPKETWQILWPKGWHKSANMSNQKLFQVSHILCFGTTRHGNRSLSPVLCRSLQNTLEACSFSSIRDAQQLILGILEWMCSRPKLKAPCGAFDHTEHYGAVLMSGSMFCFCLNYLLVSTVQSLAIHKPRQYKCSKHGCTQYWM